MYSIRMRTASAVALAKIKMGSSQSSSRGDTIWGQEDISPHCMVLHKDLQMDGGFHLLLKHSLLANAGDRLLGQMTQ